MAQKRFAFEAQFIFTCSDHKPENFRVTHFSISDELSSLYSVDIRVVSLAEISSPDDFILKKATLFINREGSFYPYSGIITSFTFLETANHSFLYSVRVQPQLWKLTLNRQNRIFQRQSIPDIIKKVLNDSELEPYYSMSSLRTGNFEQREYVVQHDETDYDFILRLMCDNGIFFHFTQEPLTRDSLWTTFCEEKLVITDDTSAFKKIHGKPLKFRTSVDLVKVADDEVYESVFKLSVCQKFIPSSVTTKSYNYRTPEVNITSVAPIDGGNSGQIFEYGGTFKTTNDAKKKAELIAHYFAMHKTIMSAQSDCRAVRAGSVIEITDHTRAELNDTYLVMKADYLGSFLPDDKKAFAIDFSNTLRLLPMKRVQHYRAPVALTPKRIPGVLNATIEGTGKDYSSIDDMGRYKVRMAFDISDASEADASKGIRLAQAYNGPDYGIHMPSHAGAEMIIAHVNGDPDKPVGLGTCPNADTMTPVKSDNKQQSAIVTAGGNKVILDDTNGKQQFSLSTPYNQSLSAGNDQDESIGADRSIAVTANETKGVEANFELTVSGNQETAVNSNKDESVTGTHTQTIDGNNTQTIAASKIVNVTLADKESVSGSKTLEVSGDRVLTVKVLNKQEVSGDATTDVSGSAGVESMALVTIQGSGSVTVDSKEIGFTGKAMITLLCGGSSVVITPGAIMLTAPAITISGKEVNIAAGALNNMLGGLVKIN
ncbi:MAG: type VI secretion system Vgr family protein [Fibrobacterota bacterium]|nr:type VI secretion system tip protein TssI/VgrG [Chitinispirillaceae bacterium]